MNLLLMRHCHSESGEPNDPTRSLTERGKKQARVMREFLSFIHQEPDHVVTSTYDRAVKTAKQMGYASIAVHLPALDATSTPDAAWATLLKQPAKRLLVITHDPLITRMLAAVCFGFGDVNVFDHGSIAHVQTDGGSEDKNMLRWLISPGLAAKMLPDDSSAFSEGAIALAENLRRASKAAVLDPLIETVRRAFAKRFRDQAAHYKATQTLQRGTSASFDMRVNAALKEAYAHGCNHAASQLGMLQEAARQHVTLNPLIASRVPSEPDRDLEDITADTDDTTSAKANALMVSGGLAAVLTWLKESSDDRASMIALQEISTAFHDGGAAVAAAIDTAVEKRWDGEDDACEEICQPAMDQEWIGSDETFANGEDEPPGHPNCRCSISYRTVDDRDES